MGGPTIMMPDFPELGIPEGTKQAGQRVDFKPTQFELAIETKGYFLSSQRATVCPSYPVTTQTEQPDPNCTVCKGTGWLYFGAPTAQDLTNYELNDLQTRIIVDNGGMVIRGIMNSLVSKRDPVNVASNWVDGSANLTVRHENKLAYYDKVTALDALIAYSEIIVADGTAILGTRYPAAGMNHLITVDEDYVVTVYKIGIDFSIVKGVVTWYPSKIPMVDTRVSAHYLCHPVWLIVEHPHAARVTSQMFKTPSPKTPTGDAQRLPVQALVRYDFLPAPTSS